MIKINLHNLNTSGAEGSKKLGFNSLKIRSLSDILSVTSEAFSIDLQSLPWKKIALPICAAASASIGVTIYENKTLDNLDQKMAVLNEDRHNIEEQEKKLKKLEPLQKTMEEDEMNFKNKLSTLKKLIERRAEANQVLVAFSKTIPSEVWLTKIGVDTKGIKLNGESYGFDQISDFMKALQGNPLFKDVLLGKTEKQKQIERDIAIFDLNITRR